MPTFTGGITVITRDPSRERERERRFVSYTNHLVVCSNNEFTENKYVLEMCCGQTWILHM